MSATLPRSRIDASVAVRIGFDEMGWWATSPWTGIGAVFRGDTWECVYDAAMKEWSRQWREEACE